MEAQVKPCAKTGSLTNPSNKNGGSDHLDQQRFILSPKPNDVLFGRGYLCREHSGTKYFRQMCQEHRAEYASSNKHDIKCGVAHKIIRAILHLIPPGRFLQLIQPEEAKKEGFVADDFDGQVWQEIRSVTLLRKVKQSLRDASSQTDNAASSNAASHIRKAQAPPPCVVVSSCNDSSVSSPSVDGAFLRDGSDTPPLCVRNLGLGQPAEHATYSSHDDTVEELSTLLAVHEEAPRFTDEDFFREQSRLTLEEQVSVLKELFGTSCQIIATNPRKRIKGPDPKSIPSVVKDVRQEIDCIPMKMKAALLEAQKKADEDEFSDGRFELFLRREGMDPQRAAKRLAGYWEERRKVFGPKKYLMSMTLDGALRDDLCALKSGAFCLLPHKDSSGRNLIVRDGSICRTTERYTRESVARMHWYLLEMVARDSGKFVLLTWEKNTTLWDYDPRLDHQLLDMERWFLPVFMSALHVCCPGRFLVSVAKPLTFAVLDKLARHRTKIHEVPQTELPGVLAEYGIFEDTLPSVMGGTVELDLSEWIAHQRSVESRDGQKSLPRGKCDQCREMESTYSRARLRLNGAA